MEEKMKKFYAVQHGKDYSCDYGSTIKREALKMAKALAKEYPKEEIRIAICTTNDDFCEKEIIIQSGTNGLH